MGTMVFPLVAMHMRSEAASAPAKAQQQPQSCWNCLEEVSIYLYYIYIYIYIGYLSKSIGYSLWKYHAGGFSEFSNKPVYFLPTKRGIDFFNLGNLANNKKWWYINWQWQNMEDTSRKVPWDVFCAAKSTFCPSFWKQKWGWQHQTIGIKRTSIRCNGRWTNFLFFIQLQADPLHTVVGPPSNNYHWWFQSLLYSFIHHAISGTSPRTWTHFLPQSVFCLILVCHLNWAHVGTQTCDFNLRYKKNMESIWNYSHFMSFQGLDHPVPVPWVPSFVCRQGATVGLVTWAQSSWIN